VGLLLGAERGGWFRGAVERRLWGGNELMLLGDGGWYGTGFLGEESGA
ncbi:MAG: hypothetical protein ACI9K5_003269, partial [Gammaproteobacteria bacterium]